MTIGPTHLFVTSYLAVRCATMGRRDPRFGAASWENFTVPCSIGRKGVVDVREGGWKHHFFQALWMSQQKKNDVTPHRFYHFQCHRRTPTEHNRTPQQTTASPPPFYLCRVIFFPVQLALVLKMQISPFYSGWACWMLWGAAAVRGHALQITLRFPVHIE